MITRYEFNFDVTRKKRPMDLAYPLNFQPDVEPMLLYACLYYVVHLARFAHCSFVCQSGFFAME